MNNNKNKSLLKDIVIVVAVLLPLLFIFIGGSMWSGGKFTGTILEELFPALFFGFAAGYVVLILVSNIFKYKTYLWFILSIISFIVTVICYMTGTYKVLFVGFIILTICILIECLFFRNR